MRSATTFPAVGCTQTESQTPTPTPGLCLVKSPLTHKQRNCSTFDPRKNDHLENKHKHVFATTMSCKNWLLFFPGNWADSLKGLNKSKANCWTVPELAPQPEPHPESVALECSWWKELLQIPGSTSAGPGDSRQHGRNTSVTFTLSPLKTREAAETEPVGFIIYLFSSDYFHDRFHRVAADLWVKCVKQILQGKILR